MVDSSQKESNWSSSTNGSIQVDVKYITIFNQLVDSGQQENKCFGDSLGIEVTRRLIKDWPG